MWQYGADPAQLDACSKSYGDYAPSASAGSELGSLNDYDGVLIFDAHDGDSVIEERWAVVRDGGQYYVKGYGDRIVRLEDLRIALNANERRTPTERAEHLKVLESTLRLKRNMTAWQTPLMETTIRSEMMRLSIDSKLIARRCVDESTDKLLPLPPNPTEMPVATNWATSERAMCPGAGPVLFNGTRQFALDVNTVENKMVVFKNCSGDDKREPAILTDTVKGHKAPILVRGPVLFEVEGINRWQIIALQHTNQASKEGPCSASPWQLPNC